MSSSSGSGNGIKTIDRKTQKFKQSGRNLSYNDCVFYFRMSLEIKNIKINFKMVKTYMKTLLHSVLEIILYNF